MKTASFFTYTGHGRISIARSTPRNLPAGYRIYKPLAPSQDMLRMSMSAYLPLYKAILSQLDPSQVFRELQALAGNYEPVLLCWERPPFTATNWCHRRLVADWFKETLQIDVPEFALESYPELF